MSEMTHIEMLATAFLSTVLGILLGYWRGLKDGEQIGRDAEWMDSFFRRIENEKHQRDEYGRFKTKKTTTHEG